MIARKVAATVLKAEAQLCSQHLAGVTNIVADILSFEGSCRSKTEPLTKDCPPNNVLTTRLHTFHSQLIPPGFKIRQLPEEIESLAWSANNCEVMDAKGEGSHERGDRYWQRWIRFLEEWGVDRDPLLDSISQEPERLLLVRGFVLHHRTFDFDPQGVATKERERPLVSSTIRDAISSVASAFRQRGRASPFHLPNRVN